MVADLRLIAQNALFYNSPQLKDPNAILAKPICEAAASLNKVSV